MDTVFINPCLSPTFCDNNDEVNVAIAAGLLARFALVETVTVWDVEAIARYASKACTYTVTNPPDAVTAGSKVVTCVNRSLPDNGTLF